jgi:cytochrome b
VEQEGAAGPRQVALVRVWDPFVRIFHWGLAASFLVAYLTRHGAGTLHYWAGGAAAALVLVRVLWGALGTRYARFSQFVKSPLTVAGYLRDIITGREARYIGHNPAGGAMIMALILIMLATATTGYLQTTDQFFGDEGMEKLHDVLGNGLLVLVLAHLGGVVLASLRHRENLVAAMISGRKRAPAPEDIV